VVLCHRSEPPRCDRRHVVEYHAHDPGRRQRSILPSDEPLRLAIEHFHRGNFGIAAHYFRDAVEKAPRDASAWIGLAASYDHEGRFDLADQAYKQAVLLAGESTALLNNRGYSYMLRGEFDKARGDLTKAYAQDPGNAIIANNLKLLDGSERIIRRDPSTF